MVHRRMLIPNLSNVGNIRRLYYFRDLSGVYGGSDGDGGREPYNQQSLDDKFLHAPGTRYPCAPLQRGLTYTSDQIDNALKATFHFKNGFEWR